MPKINLEKLEFKKGRYPNVLKEFYAGSTDNYKQIKLGDLGNLNQFGINKAILPPNSATAMRHWHEKEDEFVIILSGEAILIDDEGEHQLKTSDCAAFKAGDKNGHAIINKSNKQVVLLEIGSRAKKEIVYYPGKNLKCVIDRSENKTKVKFKNLLGKTLFEEK